MTRIFCILVLFLISCSSRTTKTLDFGKFTIEVPNRWQRYKAMGIDSYVGGIKIDDRDSVEFDLGPYSNDLNGDDRMYEYLTINGKNAKIVRPKVSGKGITGIYVDSIGNSGVGRVRFQLNGSNLSAPNQELLIKAFKTIRFNYK